jgi:acyl-CoA synthetase (AMP-forming)/AMP-acid ligase II
MNMLASELRQLTPDAVYLHGAPLSHGTGAKILPVLLVGGTNVVLSKFDPEPFAHAIHRHHATHTFLVPTIIHRLLESTPLVSQAVRALRQITFGGSAIAPRLFQAAIEQFGPILVQIYGSAEFPHPVTVLHPEDYRQLDDRVLQSAGWPAYGVEVVVAGTDGKPVAPGESGELLARGAHAMSGYWHSGSLDRAPFTPDGFYHTGDIARQDADGLVTLHDRQRDVIVSGGLNVYPSEVERVLAEHPAVRQVAVVGAPNSEWGEEVVAYVVRDASLGAGESELIVWVRTRLAGYKKPRRIVFVETMPIGANGKILKRQLRDRLWAEHDRRIG